MTTAVLERYESPTDSIELAGKAWPIAQQIARTEFVPGSLRGKPEAVLACIMTGHELGIGPMQSLAKIHVIDGRPAMAAELMRALILARGHEFWIEESSSTRVTVGGMRAGSTRETKITWTLDDAKRAGLASRQNWQKYPRAMLLARATGELARAMFADVLAGVSYTVEELSDGDFFDPADLAAMAATPSPDGGTPEAPTKATATAKKAATRKAAAPKPAPIRGDVPPLPGEDEEPLVDQVGEQEPDPGDSHSEHEASPLPGPAAIAVALKAKGIDDRDAKLRIVENMLGLDTGSLESTKDLDPEHVQIILRSIAALTAEDLAELAIPEAEVVEEEPAAGDQVSRSSAPAPPAPKNDDTASNPDTWSEAAWRSFLAERGVKVTETLKEAQRLAREDGDPGPGTLEQIVESSPSLKAMLVGFVEDLAAQRSGS